MSATRRKEDERPLLDEEDPDDKPVSEEECPDDLEEPAVSVLEEQPASDPEKISDPVQQTAPETKAKQPLLDEENPDDKPVSNEECSDDFEEAAVSGSEEQPASDLEQISDPVQQTPDERKEKDDDV